MQSDKNRDNQNIQLDTFNIESLEKDAMKYSEIFMPLYIANVFCKFVK
jgi:hypothetical protein